MRVYPSLSAAPWVLAWTAAVALAAPVAIAQSTNVPTAASAQPGENVPLAGVGGQEKEKCKLITAKMGQSAEVIEEKTKKKGEEFPFLQTQEVLLEEFRVNDDERKNCAFAFGLASTGALQAAAAGAGIGAGLGSLAGAGIGITAGLGAAAVVAAGVVASTVAGGANNTIPATSTVTVPAVE